MSVQLPQSIKTVDEVRKEAYAEFEQTVQPPELLTPPRYPRPTIVRIGDAHAWVETVADDGNYHVARRKPRIYFYAVSEKNSQVQRFMGELEIEELDTLIEQLQQAKANAAAKQKFLEADEQYRDERKSWEAKRDEYTRQREAAWQKEQKK